MDDYDGVPAPKWEGEGEFPDYTKSTGQMDVAAQIKEVLDWHLTECLHICVADCGCPEEEQAEWADRTRIIGDQAFIEHLHEKIMAVVMDTFVIK